MPNVKSVAICLFVPKLLNYLVFLFVLLWAYVMKITRRVVHVEQELLTLPEQTSVPLVLSGVGFALQFYVLCLVDYC